MPPEDPLRRYLRELCVVAPTDTVSYFLRSTRSTLKVFRHGDIDRDIHDQFSVTVAPQLIPALREIAMTFELFKFAMKSELHMSLPAVRSVTLTDVSRPFKLDTLLTVFPNLDDTLVIAGNLYAFNSERLLRFRGENRGARKKHAWKTLDRVAMSSVMFYPLGFTCPVRHLTFHPAPVLNSRRRQTFDNAREVLQDSMASRLALDSSA